MAKRQWSEFTPTQQRAIMIASAVEIIVTAIAIVDLVRRPAVQVRGPKVLWALGAFVQPVGPIAYLGLGRRSAART